MRVSRNFLGLLVLGLPVTVALAQAPAPQRSVRVLPPVRLDPGEVQPVARGSADGLPGADSSAQDSTPVTAPGAGVKPASGPAWINGTSAPPGGVRTASGSSSGVSQVRQLTPKDPLSGSRGFDKTKNPLTKPQSSSSERTGAADRRKLANANTPFQGTAANGQMVYAGPPAYRWYGWGSVTPGTNPIAPTGRFPIASANWYSITGATPGAFPVPVTNTFRQAPGIEPPVYLATPPSGRSTMTYPVMQPGASTTWNSMPNPSAEMMQPAVPAVPSQPGHAAASKTENTAAAPVTVPTIAVPPLPIAPLAPAALPSPGPTGMVPATAGGSNSTVAPLPPIPPLSTGTLPAGSSTIPPSPAPIPTNTLPKETPGPVTGSGVEPRPAPLPGSVTEEQEWQRGGSRPGGNDWNTGGGSGPASPLPIRPQSRAKEADREPIARGQIEESKPDPVAKLIRTVAGRFARDVDVRWTGIGKLKVCLECRTADEARKVVADISSRRELTPYLIDFCVLVE